MENKNLPPFYIGQKVEYITGLEMPKGIRVIISELIQSPCGCWSLHFVGELKDKSNNVGRYVECDRCNGKYIRQHKFVAWDCNSFRSIKEDKFPLIKLTKVIEKDKVLLCEN